MNTFSIKESFKRSWELFKTNKKVLVLSALVFGIVNALQNTDKAFEDVFGSALILQAIVVLIVYVLTTIVSIGWYKLLFKVIDGVPVDVKELFAHIRLFWRYVGLTLVFLCIAAIPLGLGALIVFFLGFEKTTISLLAVALAMAGGIYLAIRYSFAHAAFIDREVGIKEAFKESVRLTEGVKWKLLWFAILVGILNLLGLTLFLVGLLVTLPVTTLAYLDVYRTLKASKVAN